jgi:sugar phosphate isomerase/epimerase
MNSRRNFIRNICFCAAGLYAVPLRSSIGSLTNIGLQMYTVRDIIDKNVSKVISKIAEIGYTEIEIGGYTIDKKFWGFEPLPFKRLLQDQNLTAPAGHHSFEKFFANGSKNELMTVLDAANIVGQRYLTVSYLAENLRKDLEDYKRIAAKLNDAGDICKSAGIQLAYHNHDFEFINHGNGTGYDVLIANTDKKLLKFELDLYWATKAGKDPVELFDKHPGRFPIWHVKDLDKNQQTFTEVGSGDIDFKRIFDKQEIAGVKHIFIEQDIVTKDVFESIKESYTYVKHNLL